MEGKSAGSAKKNLSPSVEMLISDAFPFFYGGPGLFYACTFPHL